MATNPSEESNSNSDRKISRRDFLKLVGATGAIFNLSSSLTPSSKAFASGANTTYTNSNQTSLLPQPKAMTSPHVFNLDTAMPQISNISESRTIVNTDKFPIFNGNGMAAYLLHLNQGGVYEPHWHPNAAKLLYKWQSNNDYI